MKRKAIKISEAEMEIMKIAWQQPNPVTTNVLLQALPQTKDWKPTTVSTLAKRLVDKGALACHKVGKINYYMPCLTEQEYKEIQTKTFLKNVHKGSVKSFLSALHGESDLSQQDIEDLKQWLKGV